MMVLIASIYLAFAVIGLGLFRWLAPGRAVAVVYVGGLIFLPVGVYPPSPESAFPYWIIGSALPSDMWLVKAWVAPLTALLGALLFAPASWRRYRFHPFDLAMLGWCAWPLAQVLIAPSASPSPFVATAYLAAVWGVPWLLGRVYLANDEGRTDFLRVLAWLTLLLLPVAFVEGVLGMSIYGLTVQPHPFVLDGVARYFGWRPVAWFENGNQYGIWVACAAIGALGVANAGLSHRKRERWLIAILLLFMMAFAAQSMGAIGLMLMAFGFFISGQTRALACRLAVPLAGLALVTSAIYISGALPVKTIAQSVLGQNTISALRMAGRGSLPWRIAQDQRSVQIIKGDLIAGAGKWDWWRSLQTRPWGLMMLILGQFGLIGLALAMIAMVGPVIRRALLASRRGGSSQSALAMSVMIAMSLLDGLLNSFLFLPAIALAGALVVVPECERRT